MASVRFTETPYQASTLTFLFVTFKSLSGFGPENNASVVVKASLTRKKDHMLNRMCTVIFAGTFSISIFSICDIFVQVISEQPNNPFIIIPFLVS